MLTMLLWWWVVGWSRGRSWRGWWCFRGGDGVEGFVGSFVSSFIGILFSCVLGSGSFVGSFIGIWGSFMLGSIIGRVGVLGSIIGLGGGSVIGVGCGSTW